MIGTLVSSPPLPPPTAASPRRTLCRASLRTAPPPSSLYEVLQVNRTASRGEIKAAYRGLAKVYHPDSSRSDGQDFIEIREAYSTLSDPTTRAVYDLTLAVAAGRRAGGSVVYGRWETDQCW